MTALFVFSLFPVILFDAAARARHAGDLNSGDKL